MPGMGNDWSASLMHLRVARFGLGLIFGLLLLGCERAELAVETPPTAVSAGHVERLPEWPPEFIDLVARMHQESQQELLGLSTNSFQIVAGESGHVVHADQPEVIIEAVRRIIAMMN